MIKRPGTEFNLVDQSGQYINIETKELSPLFLTAASFDKGTEEMIELQGDDFFKMFGEDISFEKHGQPALQAANIIRNGGRILIKRVVADDATLANAVITATVKKVQLPKTKNGQQVYIDRETGTETLEAQTTSGKNERSIINSAEITYNVVSIRNVKNIPELKSAVNDLLVERDPVVPDVESDNLSSIPGSLPIAVGLNEDVVEYEYTYPLFIIADNGRGVSSKRICITPDYAVSKNLKFVLYKLQNMGILNLDSEYTRFALESDSITNGKNMSLSETGKGMVQIRPSVIGDIMDKFIDKVSEFSGIERDTLVQYDILFGKNNKGEDIPQIIIDEEGYDLSSGFGIALENGSNGSFGNKPFETEAYKQKLIDFFSGEDDPLIFDVDQLKIEACVDANYPLEVKKVITELVDFRKDFFFFRDLGLNIDSHESIKILTNDLPNSMYCANYCQSYNVLDPFTKKEITVSITYDIARLLINHLNEQRHTPFCGKLYNINITDFISGSISYIPRVTPKVDMKQELYDIHMNYATVMNGELTIETQITSQTQETQCSWINNILIIQSIIRDIRTLCPRIRYSFIGNSSEGLQTYANDVTQVLNLHADKVSSIEFEWSSDEIEIANHIFNASIKVKFKNFVDFEKFTIFVVD